MIDVKNITERYSENTGNFNISLSLDNGEVLIDGKNSFLDFEKIMRFFGYIPGELSLYEGLTGKKYFKIASSLKEDGDWSFVERLISFF